MDNTVDPGEDRRQLRKLVVVGLSNVGKTAIVKRYVRGSYEFVLPTIGVNIQLSDKHPDTPLSIWDISGTSRFTQLISQFMKGANGIIYVVDIMHKDSFDLNSQLAMVKAIGHEATPAVVAVNKCDLLESTKEKWLEVEASLNWARERHYPVIFASAKSDIAIDRIFDTLITHMNQHAVVA